MSAVSAMLAMLAPWKPCSMKQCWAASRMRLRWASTRVALGSAIGAARRRQCLRLIIGLAAAEHLLHHHEEQRNEEHADQRTHDHAAQHAGADRVLRARACAR